MNENEKQPDVAPVVPPSEEPAAPANNVGKVPSLEHEQSYGHGGRFKNLDAEIERELQEALGGMSDKDLYGEPAQAQGQGSA